MTDHPHYSYRVTWSEEDGEWVGLCTEFPSLSHLAPDPARAVQGIQALVEDVVEDMQANGELVPQPLASKVYSGKFITRVPSELHRRLAIEAAEMRVSLNRLVSLRLATVVTEVRGTEPAAAPPRRAKRRQMEAA